MPISYLVLGIVGVKKRDPEDRMAIFMSSMANVLIRISATANICIFSYSRLSACVKSPVGN